MYIRNVRLEELIKWLTDNGFETLDVTTLAQKLIDRYDVLTSAKDAV